MFKNLLSLYSHRYPSALVSLMHKSKYSVRSYLSHLNKTKDFTEALASPAPKNKKTIAMTNILRLGIILQIALGIFVIVMGLKHHIAGGAYFGVAIIVLYPITWAYVSVIGIILKDWFIYGSS